MPKMGFWRLGLIGWPVEHSLSPVLHAAGLANLGLAGEYELFPIPPLPAGEAKLARLLEELRMGWLDGLNVTIPHKQNVIHYMDELTPIARAVGAVNTIIRDGNWLIGDNTDVPGFLAGVQTLLKDTNPSPGQALLLGAGGAARSVLYGLLQAGWQVTIAARRVEQAEELAASLGAAPDSPQRPSIIYLDSAALRRYLEHTTPDLIVNATPLGMVPNVQSTPWPFEVELPNTAAVYDLVYHPRQTRLVCAARRAGYPAVGGAAMLVEQAALALERWTGRSVCREPMTQAFDRALPEPQEIS